MSNPWGVKLRKTGLNEQRSQMYNSEISNLEKRQNELQDIASTNMSKQNVYGDRQGSLAASAMMGQQGLLPGEGGKKKSRKYRKSRKHRKSRKSRKSRRH
jgi:hypothetical protein